MFKYIAVSTIFGGLLLACVAPELDGDPYASRRPTTNADTKAGSSTCTQAVQGEDPKKFPVCTGTKGAKGRCVPTSKMGQFSDKFETAACQAGSACVPDTLVEKGTSIQLKKCKPVLGKSEDDGRCFSSLAKDITANYDLLKNATGTQCSGDEVCAPCLNPLANNAPTGICFEAPKAGECDGKAGGGGGGGGGGAPVACPYMGPPLVDVSTFPSEDCGSGMRCVAAALLPSADLAASLKKCSKGVCAPEKAVAAAGNYVPKTCVSVAGGEGRCTNENIPMVSSQKAMLPKDTCDANELCAPCYNPGDGKATGACATAKCDAPKLPAVTFKACCNGNGAPRGKCVPKTSVPSNLQKNLGDDKGTCAPNVDVCVPSEFVTTPGYRGSPCAGSSFLTGGYTGVCLSDCLEFGFFQSLGISRGDCAGANKCVPCTNPLDGSATGAPGCPGT